MDPTKLATVQALQVAFPELAKAFLDFSQLPPGLQPAPMQSTLPRCTRIMKVPNLETQVNLSSTGNQCILKIRQKGWIVGFRCDVIADAAAPLGRNSIAVQMEALASGAALTTDGEAKTFVPVSLLCAGQGEFFPLVRRVAIDDQIAVTVKNMSAVNNYIPTAAFLFVADVDLRAASLAEG